MCIRDRHEAIISFETYQAVQDRLTARAQAVSYTHLDVYKRQHIVRVSNMPRLIVADTIPYYEVPEWKAAIKDVREMHAKGSQLSLIHI